MNRDDMDRMLIIDFLNECYYEDWDLDHDDIKHLLELDFEYIRKARKRVY